MSLWNRFQNNPNTFWGTIQWSRGEPSVSYGRWALTQQGNRRLPNPRRAGIARSRIPGSAFSNRRERPSFPRADHRFLPRESFQILVFLGARCNELCDQLTPLNGRQRQGLFSNLGKRHVGQSNRCVPEVKFPLGEPDKSSLQRAIGSMGIFMCPRAYFPIFALRRSSVGSKISCLVRFACYRRFVGIDFRDWSAGVIEFFERFRRGRDLEDRSGRECGPGFGVFRLCAQGIASRFFWWI